MIFISFGLRSDRGPRVWIETEEVTQRCHSLEILPGGQAKVNMYAQPLTLDKQSVDTGFGMGITESEVRKQWHQDIYTVLGCPDCCEEAA